MHQSMESQNGHSPAHPGLGMIGQGLSMTSWPSSTERQAHELPQGGQPQLFHRRASQSSSPLLAAGQVAGRPPWLDTRTAQPISSQGDTTISHAQTLVIRISSMLNIHLCGGMAPAPYPQDRWSWKLRGGVRTEIFSPQSDPRFKPATLAAKPRLFTPTSAASRDIAIADLAFAACCTQTWAAGRIQPSRRCALILGNGWPL